MKILMMAILLSAQFAQAGEILSQNRKIENPRLANLLYKAYVDDESLQPDGSFTFSNLIRCELAGDQKANATCELLAGAWEVSTEPSYMKDVMYTPLIEDSVLDLMEYMRVKPKFKKDDGVLTRTKSLKVKSGGKEHSLTCVAASLAEGEADLFTQCVLYQGLPYNY